MQLINFSDGGWEFSLIDLHSFFETIKQLEQYQNSHQCNHYMYLVDGDESTYQHNKERGGYYFLLYRRQHKSCDFDVHPKC